MNTSVIVPSSALKVNRARSPERVLTPLKGILGTRSVGKPAISCGQVASAVDVDVAHRVVVGPRKDREEVEIRVLALQVVLDSALVESFNRVLLSGRSLVFSYPTVHTQQSTVPPGVAEHNVTVARAFTKLMGAFVTFWDNDAGSKIHLLANPGQDVAPSERPGRKTVSWSRRCSWAACSTRTAL